MNIVDFFDPEDKTHIEAYRSLEKHGFLPHWFFERDLEQGPNWQIELMNKMAQYWMEAFESGRIDLSIDEEEL